MTVADRVAELLRARGAEAIEHPGGTLYAHLERVQNRLADLGASSRLQLAGRAHAVYGTDGFDIALLGLDERPLLTELVGPDVERLVYRYAACDRAKTWRALPDTSRVWDRFTGEAEELTPDDLRDFADLSIVNELDVAMTLSSSGRHRGHEPFPTCVEPLRRACADPSGAHSA